MKNFKRLIATIITITMILTLANVALAKNQKESIYSQDSSVSAQKEESASSSEFLSEEEYALVLEEVSNKAKLEITPELKKKVEKYRKELEKSNKSSDGEFTISASYDSISLEALLCMNDGLSVTDIFKIGYTHANAARDEAIQLYTDTTTEMKRDAFRHMTWNFRSIKDVGEHKTRVATINHEWAYKILPAVNQYEQQRIDYYYDQYYWQIVFGLLSYTDILMMAKSDADAYAITYRDGLIQSCKNSLSVFNSTFSSNSYIMDFWNNKIGRDYGKSNPTSSTNTVFTTAWNANQLIKNETTAVTSSKRSTLHSTNWWYIW